MHVAFGMSWIQNLSTLLKLLKIYSAYLFNSYSSLRIQDGRNSCFFSFQTHSMHCNNIKNNIYVNTMTRARWGVALHSIIKNIPCKYLNYFFYRNCRWQCYQKSCTLCFADLLMVFTDGNEKFCDMILYNGFICQQIDQVLALRQSGSNPVGMHVQCMCVCVCIVYVQGFIVYTYACLYVCFIRYITSILKFINLKMKQDR